MANEKPVLGTEFAAALLAAMDLHSDLCSRVALVTERGDVAKLEVTYMVPKRMLEAVRAEAVRFGIEKGAPTTFTVPAAEISDLESRRFSVGEIVANVEKALTDSIEARTGPLYHALHEKTSASGLASSNGFEEAARVFLATDSTGRPEVRTAPGANR